MNRIVGAAGRIVERNGVAAHHAGQAVVARGERRAVGAIVDLGDRADQAGSHRDTRRRDGANGAGDGGRVQRIVARAGARDRQAADGDRLARADVARVVSADAGIVEGHHVASQRTGQRVVARRQGGGCRRVVALGDGADEARGQGRRRDRADRARRRGRRELVVARGRAGDRQTGYRDGLARTGMDRVVAADRRIVERDHVAAQHTGQRVIAGRQGGRVRRVIDPRNSAGEAGRECRRGDGAHRPGDAGRRELVVGGGSTRDRQATHRHGLARTDVGRVVAAGRRTAEGDHVAAQNASQRVVADGKRRGVGRVVDLGDAAGETSSECCGRDRAHRARRRRGGQLVVAGGAAREGQAIDGDGQGRTDSGCAVGAGRGIVERDDVAAKDTRQAVVAGREGRRGIGVVDLGDDAGQARREGRCRHRADSAGYGGRGELVVARACARDRQAVDRHRLGRTDVGGGVGAGGRVVESDDIAAHDAGQRVVANSQCRRAGRVVDLRDAAREAGRQGRGRNDADGSGRAGRGELVVARARARQREAADRYGLARADVSGVVGAGRRVVESHHVAAQDSGQRVVAGAQRRRRAGVVNPGDGAREACRQRRARHGADRARRRGGGQDVVAGVGTGDRQAAHGDGLARADDGGVEGAGGRMAERHRVAAQDTGQRVVAGDECGGCGRVVDFRHRASDARGHGRRSDGADCARGRGSERIAIDRGAAVGRRGERQAACRHGLARAGMDRVVGAGGRLGEDDRVAVACPRQGVVAGDERR